MIEDLLRGKKVFLEAKAYGTDCYAARKLKKEITIDDLPHALLCNPRNGYQNYNCAINMTDKIVYTYMGMLKPNCRNATYCSAGELSPLFNDPYYRTIGIGTRIFLGGGIGFITWNGSQHNPNGERTELGIPKTPAGTLMVQGDLKQMSHQWIKGVSILGYGNSLAVGLGVPIPILNPEIAAQTGISDQDIYTQVVDYGHDYTNGISKSYGEVSYAELKSGKIIVQGKEVSTAPLSSIVKARAIAETLKIWIKEKRFYISSPVQNLPGPQ